MLPLIIVGLGSYIVYDTFIYQEEKEKEDNKQKENNSVKKYYNLEKRTKVQSLSNGDILVLVDTEGKAFLALLDNIITEDDDDETVKNNLKTLQGKFKDYSPNGYNHFGDKTLKGIKLEINDVLSVYNVNSGNAGFNYFIFIKEDGTLSYINYNDVITGKEVAVKDISGVSKAMTIIESEYDHVPYAVSLDGKELPLYDKLK